uniref:Uncharacterized protein n=1 Tax=Anguilla anguilla TaxID=7936 RepID=A0A0E9V9H0_ANGAN
MERWNFWILRGSVGEKHTFKKSCQLYS